ncbi:MULTISPECIES: HsdM family class I SAM-dependent methyltransferase [Sphingomonas]|uniref:HsdM family class I SAM-dependent methyltransferase n=1 Tax=Sphingomonas TaxID=13687 RepID=UPI000AB04DEA|nr:MULTISPECIES: N-6 DNA methylase [Sphingomonas]MBY0300137.1 SAM-dependent methyltransferase [Sphingomonas ginsenosidimutans]
MRAENPAKWLIELSKGDTKSSIDGLILVKGFRALDLSPEQYAMMEKAENYEAHSVFFEASRNNRSPVAQAFIYVSDHSGESQDFAVLHKRLWSWGGVPLLYRKTPGKVELFRCASKADFDQSTEVPKYKAYDTFSIAADISSAETSTAAWWDLGRLRNGTLWDDPSICEHLLSDTASAHRHLVDNIFGLYKKIRTDSLLSEGLQRRLLILSLLIAYLDERNALETDYFAQFHPGAKTFADVMRAGPPLVNLLAALEKRFNGHVFELDADLRAELAETTQLGAFADLVEGCQDAHGQGSFWRLYSFRDLPVELISNIYQLFVEDKESSIYTPPALVRLMLDEALSWERIDRLIERDEVILDPACGSAVYLVEAYKRLVLHWRMRNDWERPKTADLKALLTRVHGVDLEPGAIKLAAFSLCLALCEALEPEHIRKSVQLFPELESETLHAKCFFEARELGLITKRVGVIVGNPPFKSKLSTPGASQAAADFKQALGGKLPDDQLAYLFLVCAKDLLADGGVISMIQPAGFLYNLNPERLRWHIFQSWDVREILDFVSVRGLFSKGDADTKIVVVVAIAGEPDPARKVLHAIFRRSGKADAEQSFDIDYYDMHWISRSTNLADHRMWRSGLLGNQRCTDLVQRLAKMRTLGAFAKAKGWEFGQGFMRGNRAHRYSLDHIWGKRMVPPGAIGRNGIDSAKVTDAPRVPISDARSEQAFLAPLLLVRKHQDLDHGVWSEGYMTFADEIVGFSGAGRNEKALREVSDFLSANRVSLSAYVAATSFRLYNKKATVTSTGDVLDLPFPESGDLELSASETILVHDIVNYQRELIRRGDKSYVLRSTGHSALPAFNETLLASINQLYSDNPLVAHPSQCWPGIICQPYSFGPANIDWSDSEKLRGRLDAVVRQQRSETVSVTRIARIYDDNLLFLIKPDRLRFWMRSIALRDADEVLADLRAQGY